jgi:hypothetical protein
MSDAVPRPCSETLGDLLDEIAAAKPRARSQSFFTGRGDLVRLRLDHIMKAQDQPPVRRERGELGWVRRVRAKDRQDVRHLGGGLARRVPGCRRW